MIPLQKGNGDVIARLQIQMGCVTLKSCCALHCSDLAGDTLAAGEFPCSIYLTKIGEKVCAGFMEVLF